MTTIFEHLITLGSFILALGIATILTGVAMLVQRRKETVWFAPPLMWMGAIFLEQINFWLGSYNYRNAADANYIAVAFVVVYPTLLFLQSALVTPQGDRPPDLVEHHQRNHRYYAGIAAVCCTLSVLFFLMVDQLNPTTPVPLPAMLMPVAQATLALGAVIWRGRRIQTVLAAMLLLLAVVNFFMASWVLVST